MRKYRIGIIFIILFWQCSVTFAKKDDDLREFNYFLKKSNEHLLSNNDSSNYYVERCFEAAQNLNDNYYKAQAHQIKVQQLILATDLVSALLYQRKAIDLFEAYSDSTEYILAEQKLGDIFLEMDDFLRSLIQYWKVLELADEKLVQYSFEKEKDINLIRARTYAKIGFIYDELEDYSKELDNLIRSTKITYKVHSIEAEKLRNHNLIDLGFAYYRIGQYDLAETYVLQNLQGKKRFGIKYSEGQNYQILGLIAEGRKKYKLALAYLDLSDKKLKEFGIYRELLRNEFYRSKVFFKMGKFENSKLIMNRIEPEFKIHFSEHELYDFYDLMSSICLKLSLYKEALQASQKAMEFQNKRVLTKNNELIEEIIGYADEKSEMTQEELSIIVEKQDLERVNLLQLNHDRKRFWAVVFFSISIVGLIAIIIALLIAYRRITINTMKLRETDEENRILLQEVHHRVKNNFQIITSLLNLQKRQEADERQDKMLSEIQMRIQAMSLVHNILYSSHENNGEKIGFREYVKKLSMLILDTMVPESKKISIKTEGDDMSFSLETAVPLSLILNELITNSVKHGFPKRTEGNIRVLLRRITENQFRLTVQDDGIGFEPIPEGYESKGGMGIFLVDILATQLDGEVQISNENGTRTDIVFRIPS